MYRQQIQHYIHAQHGKVWYMQLLSLSTGLERIDRQIVNIYILAQRATLISCNNSLLKLPTSCSLRYFVGQIPLHSSADTILVKHCFPYTGGGVLVSGTSLVVGSKLSQFSFALSESVQSLIPSQNCSGNFVLKVSQQRSSNQIFALSLSLSPPSSRWPSQRSGRQLKCYQIHVSSSHATVTIVTHQVSGFSIICMVAMSQVS